ncbi:MAG: PKD domain-containing protein [Bacteroidales bacterium]|nr:PKD domain-containing protein [Bacteroidales bacterium]MDD3666119.1 PKD domain-containing protein [Bacteroidales bacterium]
MIAYPQSSMRTSGTTCKNTGFWRLLLIACVFCSIGPLRSQNQANNWYFGNYAGVCFNSGSPVALSGSEMLTQEGCCTISDFYGNLLFYSDGVTVWNRNHEVMLNGTGLLGHYSSTQSSVAIPQPGSSRFYYLFTVPHCFTLTGGLCYSKIDMQLDGGLGGVIASEKNILLQTLVTEKLTAVKHANGTDFWVITHERNNAEFDAFRVSAAGINPIPVTSTAGTDHTGTNSWLGYLKASPDGLFLACAVFDPVFFVEIFHFDAATGGIAHFIKVTENILRPYGVEFSPNSELVYMGNYTNGLVFQLNLMAGDSSAIIASSTEVASLGTNLGALQLGPDEKIYAVTQASYYLHQIPFPDLPGANGFVLNAVHLGGNISNLGLPTFIQSYLLPQPFTFQNTCYGDTTAFFADLTTVPDSLTWSFGDPASVPFDTSGMINTAHVFTDTGIYTVSLTVWSGGFSTTSTNDIQIHPVPQPFLGNDTTLCGGNALILNAGEGYTAYLWNDGTTGKNLIVTANGTYTVTVTDGNGCQGSDGIHVEFHEVPGPVIIKHN